MGSGLKEIEASCLMGAAIQEEARAGFGGGPFLWGAIAGHVLLGEKPALVDFGVQSGEESFSLRNQTKSK